MATVAYEVAPSLLDEESHAPVAPRRRGRWLVGGVGLALAIAGCMGVAVRVARPREPASAFATLSTMHKRLVKAFSSRALLEETDLQATATFVWNEEGAEDPKAMGVEAVFAQGTEKHDGLAIKITFNAQEGKGEELANKFRAVWTAGIDWWFWAEGPGSGRYGEYSEDDMPIDPYYKLVDFSSDEDEVVIEVKPPAGPTDDQMEKDVQEAVNKDTQFTASVFVGRTVQEMYKHRDTSVALLPQGIKGEMNAKVASALFELLNDGGGMLGPPHRHSVCHYGPDGDSSCEPVNDGGMAQASAVLKSLAKFNQRTELRYKSADKLNGAFDSYPPSLRVEIDEEAHGFAGMMPKIIRGNLTGIDDLADGVKKCEILGLPNKWEVKATFTNFHVAPLIHDLLQEIPHSE